MYRSICIPSVGPCLQWYSVSLDADGPHRMQLVLQAWPGGHDGFARRSHPCPFPRQVSKVVVPWAARQKFWGACLHLDFLCLSLLLKRCGKGDVEKEMWKSQGFSTSPPLQLEEAAACRHGWVCLPLPRAEEPQAARSRQEENRERLLLPEHADFVRVGSGCCIVHIVNPVISWAGCPMAAAGSSGNVCGIIWNLDEPLESESLARRLAGFLEIPASSGARNNRSSSCL